MRLCSGSPRKLTLKQMALQEAGTTEGDAAGRTHCNCPTLALVTSSESISTKKAAKTPLSRSWRRDSCPRVAARPAVVSIRMHLLILEQKSLRSTYWPYLYHPGPQKTSRSRHLRGNVSHFLNEKPSHPPKISFL